MKRIKIIKDKIAKLSFLVLLITCVAAMLYTPNTSADDYNYCPTCGVPVEIKGLTPLDIKE